MRQIDNRERNIIYISKALAMFSVISAHTYPIPSDSTNSLAIASEILNYCGTFGVPVLLLIAGYLYYNHTTNVRLFIKKKMETVVVPWIVCESVLWIYVIVRKGGCTLKNWIFFIIGYGHSTYFLTVLVICFFVFWKLNRNHVVIICVLSACSIFLTGWFPQYNLLNTVFGNYYLNPFNWFIFFGIGCILRGDSLSKIVDKCQMSKALLILCLASLGYFTLSFYLEEKIYYFSKFATISLAANTLLILGVAGRISDWNCIAKRIFEYIGICSYSVYLMHQFFAGAVVSLSNFIINVLVVLTRPIVVMLVVMGMIYLIDKKVRFTLIRRLVGLR